MTPISSIENLGPDFGLLPVQTTKLPTQVFAMAEDVYHDHCLHCLTETASSQKLELDQCKVWSYCTGRRPKSGPKFSMEEIGVT